MTTKNQHHYISPHPTKCKRNFGPLIDFLLALTICAGLIAIAVFVPYL